MSLHRGRFAKRVFDFVLATALLVVFAPLFLVITACIKLDTPGPVFFRHRRVGKKGRLFEMWKFRTMFDAQAGSALTTHGDKRITRFGKFLRRSSLDELPQLLNVISGEMSLVGPRPEIPEIVANYSDQQRRALAVKPGITGLSQINGRDDLPIQQKLEFEVRYVETHNLKLDLKIMLLTLPAVLGARGNRF